MTTIYFKTQRGGCVLGDVLLEDKIETQLTEVALCADCGCLLEGDFVGIGLCVDCI